MKKYVKSGRVKIKKKVNNMSRFGVTLPKELCNKLDVRAKACDFSRNKLIKEILVQYFDLLTL